MSIRRTKKCQLEKSMISNIRDSSTNEIGQAKAAAELGISKNTIYTWIRMVRLGQLNLGGGMHCTTY